MKMIKTAIVDNNSTLLLHLFLRKTLGQCPWFCTSHVESSGLIKGVTGAVKNTAQGVGHAAQHVGHAAVDTG